jgi:catechol 2,3-dioxygenase-like lactoylglutathione lyase family enzyme
MASDLDHVCIVAKDVDASIKWYKSVLGMEHTFTNADNFYPTC